MENSYQDTAFTVSQLTAFDDSPILASKTSTDLRLFMDCPYLVGGDSYNLIGLWYRYIKKTKRMVLLLLNILLM
tara:strand:- start:903 stop:1124 length:222 start_codon:yes stop_codon:yes gene_type:complete